MPHFERHFTLAQAQSLIPWVRSIILKINRIIELSRAMFQEDEAEFEENPFDAEPPDLDPVLGRYADAIRAMTIEEHQELLNGLINAIQDRGIVIQDIRRGLIDFPAMKGDDEVLICYEMSDGGRIGYWHHLDAGYAGRQPIESDEFT